MKLMDLNTFRLTYLFVVNLVILVVSLKLVVAASNSKIESSFFILSLIIFLLSFMPLQVLAEIGSGKIYVSKLFLSLPAYIFIYYDLFLCSFEYLLLANFLRLKTQVLARTPLRKAWTTFPMAFAFQKQMGRPYW